MNDTSNIATSVNHYRYFRLLVDAPFLTKGRVYEFYKGNVVEYRENTRQSFPQEMRPLLAGYLYLMITKPEYMKEVYDHACTGEFLDEPQNF